MEVVWSDLALVELEEVIDYVEELFGVATSQNVLHAMIKRFLEQYG